MIDSWSDLVPALCRIVELDDLNYGPASDPILMLYMESVKKPDKLLRHARSLVGKWATPW